MNYHHRDPLIHIAIAEDQVPYLQAISKTINEWDDCKVILQAGNGKELIEKMNPKNLPDLVITDLRMPEMNGYETIRKLKQKFPGIRIMVLSMYDDRESMLLLLKTGAHGFISKNADVSEIRKAIHAVQHKGYYFTDQFVLRIFKQITETGNIPGTKGLNEAELSYLKLLCTGKTDKEISSAMDITERRAEQIRYGLFERFAVQSRTALAIQSKERGIIL